MSSPCAGRFSNQERYWTERRCLDALEKAAAKIKGPVPCTDEAYLQIKKGRLDWPGINRIYEYFGSLGRAWLAAGVDRERVSLRNIKWNESEEEYLLEHAGSYTLAAIASHLCRSYAAVRARLNKNHNICSRHNQGYLSASELAKEYKCSCHRIRDALRAGMIKGRFDETRNRWEIDIADVWGSTQAQEILLRPKRSWKNSPTDLGDYALRYGLKRVPMNGHITYVRKEA